jgi:hypothetical protein
MKPLTTNDLRLAIPPYIFSLPSSVLTFLLKDNVFVRDLDLPWAPALTVNDAPAMEIRSLFNSVRQSFEKMAPVELTNEEGKSVKVVPSNAGVEIQYQDKSGSSRNAKAKILGLIHPNRSVRLEILESSIKSFGPTHPEENFWRTILNHRALTDVELWNYIKSVENSLGPTLRRIENELFLLTKETYTDKPPNFLVPDVPEYFENLVGPPPDSMSKGEYLRQVTIPRMKRAVEYDLVQGLTTIFPMGIRDDLLAHQFLAGLPDAGLQDAIEKFPHFHDPVSRINLLDLSLSRTKDNPFFAKLAGQLLKDLTAEKSKLRDDIDANVLFSVLLRFVTAKIRTTKGLREHPVYWQRLCAWTHTGHLVNFLKPWRVTDSLSLWLDPGRGPYHPVAAILELIEAPSSIDHWANGFDVAAYLAHRILDMFSRHPGISVQGFDLGKFVESCATTEALNTGKFFLMSLPGPLDLNSSPQELSLVNSENGNQKAPYSEPTDLLLKVTGECVDLAIWNWLAFLSHLFRPPKGTKDAVLKNLLEIRPHEFNENELKQLGRCLQLMAVVSQKFGDHEIEKEVLRIILDIVRFGKEREDIREYLMAALINCMACKDVDESMIMYSDFLFKAGLEVENAGALKIILDLVRTIKELLPITSWHFSRVEALCLAG